MIVGLTGGIGSGKSTVAQFFKELGVMVINSDQIAHDLLLPDSTIFNKVIDHFGKGLLNNDGSLNRKTLGSIIFKDPQERLWLESLLHPLIKEEIQKRCAGVSKHQYAIVEIPLLIEAKFQNSVDRILVIDCPESTQIKRIEQRDPAISSYLKDILVNQSSREKRKAEAQDIIDNTQSLNALKKKVSDLHLLYIELSR
jgi:dephospho-CoA kinase